ncbi:MAG: hypothetical protein OXN94_01845 [Chloroflexota bacterium]|nr:hypothetical protein [Chloroflexota bacterium]
MNIEGKIDPIRKIISSRPYVSLSIFVIIVIVVSIAGYARYRHVQAEIAAQQTIAAQIQRGFHNWRDDISLRLSGIMKSLQGTAQEATNVVGGAWGFISYLVTAALDFIGNLHIMIPVTIIYFGVGFFGTLKMRVATLLGAVIAFFLSTRLGIVPASVIGLLLVSGLLFGNRLYEVIRSRIQQARSNVMEDRNAGAR